MSNHMPQQIDNIDPRLLTLDNNLGLESAAGQNRTLTGSAPADHGGSVDQAAAHSGAEARPTPKTPSRDYLQCKGCATRFATKGVLQRHIRTQHTGFELCCPMPLCRKGRPGMGFKRKYMLAQHLGNAKANVKGSTGHGIAEHKATRLANEAVAVAKARLQTAATEQAASGSIEEDLDTALNGMEQFEMLFSLENL